MFWFWILVAAVTAVSIYWLMDWKSHHEDDE